MYQSVCIKEGVFTNAHITEKVYAKPDHPHRDRDVTGSEKETH